MKDFKRIVDSLNVFLLSFITLAIALLSLGVIRYGSIQNSIAVLRGASVLVDHNIMALGEVTAGEKVKVPFKISNLSDQGLTVLGSSTTCSCVIANDPVPFVIEPYGSRDIDISVAVASTAKEPQIEQIVRLFTNRANHREIRLVITGSIRKGGESTVVQ